MSRIASRDAAVVRLTARLSRSDVLWVANTAHGPAGHWHARVRAGEVDHDHLELPETAVRYLADHGVPVPEELPDQVALAELGIVRATVQRLLLPAPDPWADEGRELLSSARYGLDAGGRLADGDVGWRAFCRDLLLPLLALVEDRAALRRCSNPACRLVFEDGSPNHARRWCDTKGCGNRDRVRRARRRDAVGPTPGADTVAPNQGSDAGAPPGASKPGGNVVARNHGAPPPVPDAVATPGGDAVATPGVDARAPS